MANPWLDSTTFVATVKRKISFPTYQSTFTDSEILDFANDEVRDSILPNMLQYHEEYFVTTSVIDLIENVSSYAIPNRAVGMKLRDLSYADGVPTPQQPFGNLYEMTLIGADNKAWFQNGGVSNNSPYKFYVQGNNVVLIPAISSVTTGKLVFDWFMRPNQMVTIDRAFIVNGFSRTITITNTSVVAGDTVTFQVAADGSTTTVEYVFTAVAGSPAAFEFMIGATSSATATNLNNAINSANIGFSANNGTPATNVIKILYQGRNSTFTTTNVPGFAIQATIGLESADTAPANIAANTYVDLLQMLPGHKTLNYDIFLTAGAVSGNTLSLSENSVPKSFIIGDYVCSRNECIIPQIPPELHSSLAERVCARILAAIGDQQGLTVANQKIDSLNKNEPMLIDNRVDGAPQKVLNKSSHLRYSGWFGRRRY